MRVRFSERFRRSYESAPPSIQRTVHRKLEGDTYRLHDIIAHPK